MFIHWNTVILFTFYIDFTKIVTLYSAKVLSKQIPPFTGFTGCADKSRAELYETTTTTSGIIRMTGKSIFKCKKCLELDTSKLINIILASTVQN